MFDSHIKEIYEKASQKLVALSRVTSYLEPEEEFPGKNQSFYIAL